MKILYWNVYTGSKAGDVLRELRQMIDKHRPDIIGLGEADHLWFAVREIKGYRPFSIKASYRGEGDTVVLVRDDVDLKHWHWLKMTKWWVGPKHGLKQGPKRYWSGRIKDPKLGLVRVSIGHWPFNYAREETEQRIVSWFARTIPGRKSVHVGDLNTHPDDMSKFVTRFKGRHVGEGIDRAMFKNMGATAHSLGRRGVSDHPAVLFHFTR